MLALRAKLALAAAFLCAGGLVLAWLATFSAPGRWLDRAALQGFLDLRGARTGPLADRIAHLGDPLPFALAAAALLVVALLRGRPRVAMAVGAMLLASNLTTQLLKPLLAEPRPLPGFDPSDAIAPASWPSGHATASMALALGAVMVAPARLRPAVAVAGAGFAVAVSYALLALGWHFPSDVMAGYSVAALWTAVAVAAVWWTASRWPVPRAPPARLHLPEALGPAAVAIAACGAVALLVFLARPEQVAWYARAHTTFVVVAAAIAVLCGTIATALALALRR